MRRFFLKFIILAAMLLGLPLLGVVIAGYPLARYLEFPPISRYIEHAPFSWIAFGGYTVFIIIITFHLIVRRFKAAEEPEGKPKPSYRFPWWGWLAVVFGIIAWIFAWSRFSWFAQLQPHTFTPLWVSFIVVINALTLKRAGRCMMLDRPVFFLILFPFSALFWWFFEYLNRFVQNWHYAGVRFQPTEYFWYATLSFSTVLPAVLGAMQWIASFKGFHERYGNFFPIKIAKPCSAAGVVLALSGFGLAGIGLWPNYLFPLLWISPLLIVVSLQTFMKERHVFSDIACGNWQRVVTSALAALLCGLFWETWNFYSLAKWLYTVPYVHRFQIFEMPILGYAGYLPFGLECVTVGLLIENLPIFSKNPSILLQSPGDA
ncbi:MAG TPA: hypothetical protein HPQ03_09595 [Deltaproteobacteria bacterium]|nr:hypothetical protein [Deltaproteobacteria bacterium]